MPFNKLSDGALITRASAGDSPAFDELVSRHHAVLFHTALAIVRSYEDAEDVTQNAWIRAYTHLGRFAGTSSIRTWLVAIARHAAIDHRRVVAKQSHRFVSDYDTAALENRRASDLGSPEDLILRKERHTQLTRWTAALPQRLRAVLKLWRSERYSYAEMADKAGLPIGTLKSRIWEARQQLTILYLTESEVERP